MKFKPEVKVDKLDRKILYILENNSRLSDSAIARHLKVSRETVTYRIKRLEDVGILHGFHVVTSDKELGKKNIIVGIKLNSLINVEEVFVDLDNNKQINAVFQSAGMWDILLGIVARDLESCYKVFQDIMSTHRTKIRKYDIFIKLQQQVIPAKLLVSNKKEREHLERIKEKRGSSFQHLFNTRKPKGDYIVNDKDLKILSLLKHDARMKLNEICKKTSFSLFEVKNILERLVENNVIQRFVPYILLDKIGIQYHMAFLNVSKDAEESFKTWAQMHPNVIWWSRYIGPYNFRLTLFVKDNAHLSKILNKLSNQFGSEVSDIEPVAIFRNLHYKRRTRS